MPVPLWIDGRHILSRTTICAADLYRPWNFDVSNVNHQRNGERTKFDCHVSNQPVFKWPICVCAKQYNTLDSDPVSNWTAVIKRQEKRKQVDGHYEGNNKNMDAN